MALDTVGLRVNAVIGNYRLNEQIGVGGSALVWSAWDMRLNRLVALKILPTANMDDDDDDKSSHRSLQFEREAEAISRLQHPFIVPLYDFGETDKYRYLVMRYLSHGSLEKRLNKTPLLPTSEVIRLMTLVGSALDYIHEERIIHRDLKPANILLDAQMLPYLSDFGVAKLEPTLRRQHTIVGTLLYMAPEQVTGSELSVRTDMYSFGLMLYEMFTGQLPFKDEQSLGVMQVRSHVQLPDVRPINSTLPAALNDILRDLTLERQDLRPNSAVAVMRSIANLFELPAALAVIPDNAAAVLSDSANYDGVTALERAHRAWLEQAKLPDRTEFALLHEYLQQSPAMVTGEVRAMMFSAALQFEQFTNEWGQGPLTLPFTQQMSLRLKLVTQQLWRDAWRQYLWTAVGSVVGLTLLVYAVRPETPFAPLQRPLNAIGIGLLFGLLYALGVWAAWQISIQMQTVRVWWRAALAIVVGGVLMAGSFALFHSAVLSDYLEPEIALGSGLVYVSGFTAAALLLRWLPRWLPFLLSAAGVFAAMYIPWLAYLNYEYGEAGFALPSSPFIFREDGSEFLLVLLYALCVAAFVVLRRARHQQIMATRRQTPAPTRRTIVMDPPSPADRNATRKL